MSQSLEFWVGQLPFDTGFHSVPVGITLHSQESRDLPHGGCPPELGLERPRDCLKLLCPRPDLKLLRVLVTTFVKFRDGVPMLFQSFSESYLTCEYAGMGGDRKGELHILLEPQVDVRF